MHEFLRTNTEENNAWQAERSQHRSQHSGEISIFRLRDI